jgi:hypothetical protein
MWGFENYDLKDDKKYDLILCTEVVYNSYNTKPLLETI